MPPILGKSYDFFTQPGLFQLMVGSFLFLPFPYALTIQVGFPLKITEVFITISIILLILFQLKREIRFDFYWPDLFFKILFIFLLLAVLSAVTNVFWQYDYTLSNPPHRFGQIINSLLKTAYIIVIYFTCLLSYYSFQLNKKKSLLYLCYGAIACASYGWYLFIFSLNGWDVFLLPGMDEWPQHGLYSFGHFIRSGTFKEGNHTGLFLLTAAFIAYREKKYLFFVFISCSLIPTVSVIAFLCLGLFLGFVTIDLFLKKNYNATLAAIAIFCASIFIISQNPDGKFVAGKIIWWKTSEHQDAERSKQERLELVKAAFRVGAENPLLGVGPSNFTRHVRQYDHSKTLSDESFSYIPNNIYMEIFSELGLPALLCFISMTGLLLVKSLRRKDFILLGAIFSFSFYLLAYPSFTLLFIWVFYAYILAEYQSPLSYSTNGKTKHNISTL